MAAAQGWPPAARMCPSSGSSWRQLSSGGDIPSVAPGLSPSAAEAPVTGTCWHWFVVCSLPATIFPTCRPNPLLLEASSWSVGVLWPPGEGCCGSTAPPALVQLWLQACTKRAVGARGLGCSAEPYFVLFYFSNKRQNIIKLSSFDGMKP